MEVDRSQQRRKSSWNMHVNISLHISLSLAQIAWQYPAGARQTLQLRGHRQGRRLQAVSLVFHNPHMFLWQPAARPTGPSF